MTDYKFEAAKARQDRQVETKSASASRHIYQKGDYPMTDPLVPSFDTWAHYFAILLFALVAAWVVHLWIGD